jgi:hypothetical protein
MLLPLPVTGWLPSIAGVNCSAAACYSILTPSLLLLLLLLQNMLCWPQLRVV